MIKRLEIKNVVLIEHAIIDFEKGLNVLTGETGSGKSVIVDSINFVLGAKADKTLIKHGKEDCFVSIVFDVSSNATVKSVLAEYDTEYDDEIIISRKFNVDSKSTIRVNGVPYTLGMLKNVTTALVDVHGQSEHYSLTKLSEQLKVLDRFSDKQLLELKEKNREICKELKEIDKSLLAFGGSEAERAIRADILKFQIEEIESAELLENEEDELIILKKKIQNAEKIAQALNCAENGISSEGAISDILGEILKNLGQISGLDERYDELYQRVKDISVEITDVCDTASDYLSDIDFDGREADRVEERLDKIKSLKKKYGSSIDEINEFLSKAQGEYEKLINFDAEYENLTKEKSKKLLELNQVLSSISEVRQKCAIEFSEKVTFHLKELAMKESVFKVEFKPRKVIVDAPYPENGNDEIEFMFSANKGQPISPLAKIISGGEMSRFMLALKTIISEYQDISTYIFDEIDVGISGKTAQIVAEKFVDIARNVQVISISHLPQICSFSDASFVIKKKTDEEQTFICVEKLDEKGKIDEIVRIIGGDGQSETAKNHAIELIEVAKKYKSNK